MASPAPTVDHIVLLVPYQGLKALPSWLTDALTILPGGQHTGGLTENALVVFPDGTYIEIIAFVPGADPVQRAAHRWGLLAEGQVIDWALSLLEPEGSERLPEAAFPAIQERVHKAGAGFRYADVVPGGRMRPDGVELKWAIGAPRVDENAGAPSLAAGELPFWCLDRTARDLRVPYRVPENVSHPSGAVGVAGVTIAAKGSDKVQRLRKVYDAIWSPDATSTSDAAQAESSWDLHVPVPQGKQSPKLVIRELTNAEISAITITQLHDSPADVSIELSLFTKGEPGQIKGHIGRGIALRINLVAIE
ncbi:hypothetical protein GQ53DRAFT_742326 [Thozetella sp. PMI_491]|nr:hypothetical protein GQ53DRAFT_742326 [Thozetella sp. PMI_491]